MIVTTTTRIEKQEIECESLDKEKKSLNLMVDEYDGEVLPNDKNKLHC